MILQYKIQSLPPSSHIDIFPRYLLYPFLLSGHLALQWMVTPTLTVLSLSIVGSHAGFAFSLNNSHCIKTQAAYNKNT